MNALILATVLLFVIVAVILAVSHEFGKGADAVKGTITLLVLTLISGYVAALASGSL